MSSTRELFTGGPPARHLCVTAQVAGEHPWRRGPLRRDVQREREREREREKYIYIYIYIYIYSSDQMIILTLSGFACKEKRVRRVRQQSWISLDRKEGSVRCAFEGRRPISFEDGSILRWMKTRWLDGQSARARRRRVRTWRAVEEGGRECGDGRW